MQTDSTDSILKKAVSSGIPFVQVDCRYKQKDETMHDLCKRLESAQRAEPSKLVMTNNESMVAFSPKFFHENESRRAGALAQAFAELACDASSEWEKNKIGPGLSDDLLAAVETARARVGCESFRACQGLARQRMITHVSKVFVPERFSLAKECGREGYPALIQANQPCKSCSQIGCLHSEL